jgi:hypothetical protein
VSSGTGVVGAETSHARARTAGVALTVLLTGAIACSVLWALWVTVLFLSQGWPRAGLVSAATLVVLGSWAPVVVTAVVAGRHDQRWWTPARLGIAAAAVTASMCLAMVATLVGLAPG